MTPAAEVSSRRHVASMCIGGVEFVIGTDDPEVVEAIDAHLGDFGSPDIRSDTGVAATPTVFVVDRIGPSWTIPTWAVTHGGELLFTSSNVQLIVRDLLSEAVRCMRRATTPRTVPVHGAAAVRGHRAVVFCGPTHAGKSTLVAWLVRRGWSFLSDDITLLDTNDEAATVVHPFPQPILVRGGGPIEVILGRTESQALSWIRASTIGSLGRAAPLAVLVFPSYSPTAETQLSPRSAARTLTEVSELLPFVDGDGSDEFRALADVVTRVPSYALPFADLAAASVLLEALVDGLPADGIPTPSEETL